MIMTTEDLVSSVKRRSLAPTSQKTFQDSDIIGLLNEEMTVALVPDIVSVREDYFLTSKRTTIIASQSGYPLPDRAIGNALKDVFWVFPNGTDKKDLPRISLKDTIEFIDSVGEPDGYLVQGDQLIVYPEPRSSPGFLEQWYLQRPSTLVPTTSVCKISSVSSVGGLTTFTVDTDLTGSLSVGSLVDFLNAQSPVALWSSDVAITAITASTIEVSTSNVQNSGGVVSAGVGDYISLAGKANIPMLPQEFHPLLAEMGAARMVQALGHNDKLQAIMANIDRMRKACFQVISNRVESDSRPIVNRNGIFAHTWGGGGF